MDCSLQHPILMNCIKHHLHYICSAIRGVNSHDALYTLLEKTNYIGASLTDLYCGEITPAAIGNFMYEFLNRRSLLEAAALKAWLAAQNDYRIITFPDNSDWVLRFAENNPRFAHIHPAKTGPLHCRFKAKTMKTGILACALARMECKEANETYIARAREILGLAPLNQDEPHESLERFLKLLKNNL